VGAPFGGRQPAGATDLVIIWLCAAVSPFLGRPASYRRLLALVLIGQFGLHLVLSGTAGHGPRPMPTPVTLYYAEHSMLAEPGGVALPAVGHADDLTSGLAGLVRPADLTMEDASVPCDRRPLWGGLRSQGPNEAG